MMVQPDVPSMQVLEKQTQLGGISGWLNIRLGLHQCVFVHAVKVYGGAGPESSHSAYILDGWFAGATLLRHKMMHIKRNVRRCSLL